MLNRKLYKIKGYLRGYKKKLKSINKTRERLNVANYITNVFNDLEDELDHCDKVFATYYDPKEEKYNFTIE